MLLNMVTVGYSQIAVIIPLVAAAPRYFSGKVPLGVLFQRRRRLAACKGALSWIVDRYDSLRRVARDRRAVGDISSLDRVSAYGRAIWSEPESDDGALHLRRFRPDICPDGHQIAGARGF